MPKAESETSTRPGRRDFLTLGAAAAAVVAGIGKARSVSASAAADPIPALVARRMAIVEWINKNTFGYNDVPELYAELYPLEDRVFGEIASTRDGLIAQLRFLRSFLDEGFDFDDDCGCLVDNVIAGLAKLGGIA